MNLAELPALLLQTATLTVAIRKLYKSLYSGTHKFWTYVLLLQDNCVYVGSTDNYYQRFLDHEVQSLYSSAWVRERGPVVRILELFGNSDPDDERYKFLEYCTLYGYEKVRGSTWSQLVLKTPPAPLRTFIRNRSDFEYVPREALDSVHSQVKVLAQQLKN